MHLNNNKKVKVIELQKWWTGDAPLLSDTFLFYIFIGKSQIKSKTNRPNEMNFTYFLVHQQAQTPKATQKIKRTSFLFSIALEHFTIRLLNERSFNTVWPTDQRFSTFQPRP